MTNRPWKIEMFKVCSLSTFIFQDWCQTRPSLLPLTYVSVMNLIASTLRIPLPLVSQKPISGRFVFLGHSEIVHSPFRAESLVLIVRIRMATALTGFRLNLIQFSILVPNRRAFHTNRDDVSARPCKLHLPVYLKLRGRLARHGLVRWVFVSFGHAVSVI